MIAGVAERHLPSLSALTLAAALLAAATGCGSSPGVPVARQATQAATRVPAVSASAGTADGIAPLPTLGLPGTTSGLSPAPEFGIVVDSALNVVDVDSMGAASGLVKPGDRLVALNGEPLAPLASVGRLPVLGTLVRDSAERAAQSGAPITLQVLRGGREIDLRLVPAARAPRPGQPTPTAVPPAQQFV